MSENSTNSSSAQEALFNLNTSYDAKERLDYSIEFKNSILSPIYGSEEKSRKQCFQDGKVLSFASSSEEDTSDEAFIRRHLPYELQEQNASMRVYHDFSEEFSRCSEQSLSGWTVGELDSPHLSNPSIAFRHSPGIRSSFSQQHRFAGELLSGRRAHHYGHEIEIAASVSAQNIDINSQIIFSDYPTTPV